ncbi:MAG: DUF1800 domain-containing protein [Flavobacterium sp.]|nr:DUF1800 domain-containing protein [Flavobacterium sp.]
MDKYTLWSLRLGYSAKQGKAIKETGINSFLDNSFAQQVNSETPEFIQNSPKSFKELQSLRKKLKSSNPEEAKAIYKKEQQTYLDLKSWWIGKMMDNEFPLREKMTCFWHNHYVSTYQKVKVNNWIFQHNQILRENAFGNFKLLTKKIIQTNAMVSYLDNTDNRKGNLNENLSRELLELFTLGIGNYTEQDVKNGAKGLAGLGIGEESATYRKIFEDTESFSYLGESGNLKIDQMVDVIFQHPKVPYLITGKILKWFIYDNPTEELVHYYGSYFKEVNFEIKPLLTKIFTEEFAKNNSGSKIKNPLEYILQLIDELNIPAKNGKAIAFFIKDQGMDLFNQPNVKGWDGGNSWLTSQIFLQRNTIVDALCNGKPFGQKRLENDDNSMQNDSQKLLFSPKLNWNKNQNNKQIIAELGNRLLFQISENNQKDFEKIVAYDFDSSTEGSDNAVLRLFNYMAKLPEFQLI